MNIQIFGTKKSFDTKKAERFFKERNINFHSVDLKKKGLSKGELRSILNSIGSIDKLIDEEAKDKDALAFIKYSPDDTKAEKLLENPQIIKEPIVRNGQKATVGVDEETWEKWIKE